MQRNWDSRLPSCLNSPAQGVRSSSCEADGRDRLHPVDVAAGLGEAEDVAGEQKAAMRRRPLGSSRKDFTTPSPMMNIDVGGSAGAVDHRPGARVRTSACRASASL